MVTTLSMERGSKRQNTLVRLSRTQVGMGKTLNKAVAEWDDKNERPSRMY
jgi:hypothetical protein